MKSGRRWTIVSYVSIAIIVAFLASAVRFLGAIGELPMVALPEVFWRVVFKNTIILGVIAILMRLEGDGFAGLALSRKRLGRQMLFGVILGPVMLIFGQVLVTPIVSAVVPGPSPVTITAWFQDLSYIPLWAVLIVYGGGLGEELTRVFVLTRFEKRWGRPGLALAILAHATAFGMAHLYQGIQVAIGLGISAVVYSLIFARRRSAIEMITAHITFDAIGVTLGFFMFYNS